MNIYIYELKALKKSIGIWMIALFSFLMMYMAFFPAFGDDIAFLDSIMENYPEEMLKAMGIYAGLPLSTITGYFAFTFTFIQLLGAIQSSNYGFGILSSEERDLTADFLMSKPVSRRKILLSKFFAAVTALAVSNTAVWIGSFLALELFRRDESYERQGVIILLAGFFFFQLFYLLAGMFFSVTVRKIRSVLSYSMALAFGTYIINAVKSIADSSILGYLTPFNYLDPQYILKNNSLDFLPSAIASSLIILLFAACYRLYISRDIHSL